MKFRNVLAIIAVLSNSTSAQQTGPSSVKLKDALRPQMDLMLNLLVVEAEHRLTGRIWFFAMKKERSLLRSIISIAAHARRKPGSATTALRSMAAAIAVFR